MKRLISIAGALPIITLLLYALACDSNKPTESPPESKDYVVWMHNMYRPQELWGYHPSTGTIDTLLFPDSLAGPLYRVTISHDATKLYVVTDIYNVCVYTMPDLRLEGEVPILTGDPVVVSPDGKLIAITGPDMYILSTVDLSTLYHDTAEVRYSGVFSTDAQTFYSTWLSGPLPGQYVYRLPVDRLPAIPQMKYLMDGGIAQVSPTPDQSKWLLYLVYGGVGGFAVYDTLQDSIIFEQFLYPGIGAIATTPDGRWAFYTNPGGGIFPLGESIIRVFDIENNRIDEEIVTNLHGDTTAPTHCPIQEMVVTPDGRYLVGTTYPSPNQLICYDIVKRELVDYIYFGEGTLISNLTVQLQP